MYDENMMKAMVCYVPPLAHCNFLTTVYPHMLDKYVDPKWHCEYCGCRNEKEKDECPTCGALRS